MKLVVVMIGAAVLALGACGSDDTSVGTPNETSPDDPVTSPPVDPTDPTDPGGAALVEPRPGAINALPSAFESATVLDDGRTISIMYWAGIEECYQLDRVEVDESATAVTLTLYVGTNPDLGADAACIDIAQSFETRVTLDEPVGDRTIVDGSL